MVVALFYCCAYTVACSIAVPPVQPGMMGKENIANYDNSIVRMKQEFDPNNRATVHEWSDAILEYVHGLHANDQPAVVNLEGLAAAAGVLAGQEMRCYRKDEIEIPVQVMPIFLVSPVIGIVIRNYGIVTSINVLLSM